MIELTEQIIETIKKEYLEVYGTTTPDDDDDVEELIDVMEYNWAYDSKVYQKFNDWQYSGLPLEDYEAMKAQRKREAKERREAFNKLSEVDKILYKIDEEIADNHLDLLEGDIESEDDMSWQYDAATYILAEEVKKLRGEIEILKKDLEETIKWAA